MRDLFAILLLAVLAVALPACENNSAAPSPEPDGDIQHPDGDGDNDFDLDAKPTDGDTDPEAEPDADSDPPPITSRCIGECRYPDSTRSFCVRDNLCECVNAQWRLSDCDDICKARGGESLGCPDPDKPLPFCNCTDPPPPCDPACGAHERCVDQTCTCIPGYHREGDACVAASGTGSMGAPCPFGGVVNSDASACVDGLQCEGLYADGSDGGMALPCTEDADCRERDAWPDQTFWFGEWGVCENGFCGASWCTAPCEESRQCSLLGKYACCGDAHGDDICFPPPFCSPPWTQYDPGAPCAWGDINRYEGECADRMTCIGTVMDGTNDTTAMPCESDADCKGSDGLGWGGVCSDGVCAVSWCTVECTTNNDCIYLGQRSCCRNDNWCDLTELCIGDSGPGDPCPYEEVVNADADNCNAETSCIGAYADDSNDNFTMPCNTDEDCKGEDVLGPHGVCAEGFCGVSWCSMPCNGDNDCSDMGQGACCGSYDNRNVCYIPEYCAPIGNAGPGDPCPYEGGVNTDADNCNAETSCIGLVMDGSQTGSTALACESDADCLEAGSHADCGSEGYCGIAWCASNCSADADCQGEIFGASACCQSVSGQGMCIVEELCD